MVQLSYAACASIGAHHAIRAEPFTANRNFPCLSKAAESAVEVVENCQDLIAFLQAEVKLKSESRREFQPYLAVDDRLKALRVVLQMVDRRLLKRIIAEHGDLDGGVPQVPAAGNAGYGNEPRLDGVALHDREHRLGYDPLKQGIY